MALKALLLLASIAVVAGKPMYSGKRFVASFFPVFKTGYTDKDAGSLYIAHRRQGNCTVINSDGNIHNIQLRDNVTVTQFNLPLATELALGGYVQKRAIELECKVYVNLYIFNRRHTKGGSEAYPVLPVDSLSVSYLVPSVSHNPLLGVVAVSDNTNVTIQLKSIRDCTYTFNGTTYRHGSELTAVLGKGDVLQIAPPVLHPPMDCDFTGSVVKSSDPVAVFTGSVTANLEGDSTGDSVMSQIPPVELWGTSFIVTPKTAYERCLIRVIAYYNHTMLQRYISYYEEKAIIDEGESYDLDCYPSDSVQYINSTKPILILQIIGEYRRYSVFSSIVPAIDHYGLEYLIPDIQTTGMNYGRRIVIATSSNCSSHIDVDAKWESQLSTKHPTELISITAPHNLTAVRSDSLKCPFAVHVTGMGNQEMFGFYAIRSMSQVEALPDAVELTCSLGTWHVTIDLHKLSTAYPVAVSKNIYMANTYCPGVLDGDVLVFNFSYNDCNTIGKTSNTSMTFSNYLTEYERDPETDLVISERWRYNIGCRLPRSETHVINVVLMNPAVVTGETSGSVKDHEAVIRFYSDGAYTKEIMGNPLKVDLGSSVYVQVEMRDVSEAKLLVDNCYISDNTSTVLPLIQNRCAANAATHVLGHVDKFTRFYFEAFQLPINHNNLHVNCDVTFCSVTDFSPECQSGCQKTSQ
ncbi:uncharacterized protein LOC124274190 [Haliotis rubra]|uniref:uncharacterized protein LOC124274190 n=1 Tax=Haliotis rubra TaxID=36100 RepID=UPI001EE5108F|nr:uncharacterized protein LOC124274190 [Haliotis rubra]